MSIVVKSYMGKFGFMLRKYFPTLTGAAYLKLQRVVQLPTVKRLAEQYDKVNEKMPLCVSIETVNRCNGVCSFCPANCNTDKREFTVMSMETYSKIVDDLCAADYSNNVLMFNNNEPFLDKLFIDRLALIREKLPKAQIAVSTNGTLLTDEKLDAIAGFVDKLIVSNYSESYMLTENSQRIVKHVKANPRLFESVDITVEYRYINEKLTNRAGLSPNRKNSNRIYSYACVMPFTDIVIYASGKVGLCCCDVTESVCVGDAVQENLLDIFHSEKMAHFRELHAEGKRGTVSPCKYCDFIGKSNMRYHAIRQMLNNKNAYFDI